MKIRTKPWEYLCSDGCCYDWGVTLFIDDKEVEGRSFHHCEDALAYVLTDILGHSVTEDTDY